MRNDLPDHPASTQVARVLRTLALNEDLTRRVPFDPLLGPLARKVARRYVAGEGLSDAMELQIRGHCVNRNTWARATGDPRLAVAETQVFLEAARRLPAGCSVSLDLSHIGLVIDQG